MPPRREERSERLACSVLHEVLNEQRSYLLRCGNMDSMIGYWVRAVTRDAGGDVDASCSLIWLGFASL
jgi:hypothetical protein